MSNNERRQQNGIHSRHLFTCCVYPFSTSGRRGDLEERSTSQKYSWFQALLHEQTCRELIIYDPDVRRVIGRFKTEKLHKKRYNLRCERKLLQALQRAF